jgi:hypothetical protein
MLKLRTGKKGRMYYQVIEKPSAENLTAVVSALVEEKGWIPQGGVAVTLRKGSAGKQLMFHAQDLTNDDN